MKKDGPSIETKIEQQGRHISKVFQLEKKTCYFLNFASTLSLSTIQMDLLNRMYHIANM